MITGWCTQIDAETENRETALHYASRKGYQHITKLLVEQGALPDKEGKHGTPAAVAAQFHQLSLGDLLTRMCKEKEAKAEFCIACVLRVCYAACFHSPRHGMYVCG